jgi:hypothetical protein
VKLDYQLNQAHHLSGVVNIRDWKNPTSQTAVNGASGTEFVQDRFIIGTWTMVIGSNKVNELRYQWGQDNQFTKDKNVPPGVDLTNLFFYGLSTSTPGFTNEYRTQFSDNFSFSKGTHAFKTGVDVNLIHDLRRSGNPSAGRYTYSNAAGVVAGCPTSGTALIFCDWLVDLYGVSGGSSDTRAIGKHWTQYTQLKDARYDGDATLGADIGKWPFTRDKNYHDYAAYFQDTWKVRPDLTLNLGLRYDLQIVPQPSGNMRTPFLTKYTTMANTDYGAVQPRIGMAWNFARNTVLRAGIGIFYGKTVANVFESAARTNGLEEQVFTCSPTATDTLCAPLTYPNLFFSQQENRPAPAFPGTLTPVVLNPLGDLCTSNPAACSVRGLDPEILRPRAYQGELAFERQLPGTINFSASYIFNRGLHLPGHWDANLAPPTVNKVYDVVNDAGVTQFSTTVPFFTSRIDPAVGAMLAEFTVLNSMYNALVLTVRKPMSHDFEVLANYTLSKATDNGAPFVSLGGQSGLGNALEGQQVLNPYDRTETQSYSGSHNPHRFTTSAIWQPGYARNLNGLGKALLDGWSLSSAITATTGTRYNAIISSTAVQCSRAIIAPVTTCAGAGGVTGLDGGMMASVLQNTSVPGSGPVTFIPRASFALPSYTNIDVRTTKQFQITERVNFEVRGEIFNLLNSTLTLAVETRAYNYGTPSPTGSASITCPSTGTNAHANTCMVPLSTFQQPTVTTSNLLGARQVQFGARLNF